MEPQAKGSLGSRSYEEVGERGGGMDEHFGKKYRKEKLFIEMAEMKGHVMLGEDTHTHTLSHTHTHIHTLSHTHTHTHTHCSHTCPHFAGSLSPRDSDSNMSSVESVNLHF